MQSQLKKTNRLATLKCFEEDFEWALQCTDVDETDEEHVARADAKVGLVVDNDVRQVAKMDEEQVAEGEVKEGTEDHATVSDVDETDEEHVSNSCDEDEVEVMPEDDDTVSYVDEMYEEYVAGGEAKDEPEDDDTVSYLEEMYEKYVAGEEVKNEPVVDNTVSKVAKMDEEQVARGEGKEGPDDDDTVEIDSPNDYSDDDDSLADPTFVLQAVDIDGEAEYSSDDSERSTVIASIAPVVLKKPRLPTMNINVAPEPNQSHKQPSQDSCLPSGSHQSNQASFHSDKLDSLPSTSQVDQICSQSSDFQFEKPVCDGDSHTVPEEETILRDKQHPQIYIQKVAKTFEKKGSAGSAKGLKKNNRVFNSYHCCMVCGKLVSNIQTHIKTHKANTQVKQIVELEKKEDNSKEVAKLKALIRNRGDHLHNQSVMQTQMGELLISRRPTTFSSNDYQPCPLCFEWILLSRSIGKHQKTCPGQKDKEHLTKGEAIIQAAILTGKIETEPSKALVKEVLPIMTRDDITEIAKGDPLIIALGNNWMRRNVGNTLKRKYYTSTRMRAAARLLQNIRKLTNSSEAMFNYLQPIYFDKVAEAALLCAQVDSMDDDEDLKHPSAAIKLGYDLSRLANAKLGIGLRSGERSVQDEGTHFLTLVKLEWSEKVTRLAQHLLNERRMCKQVHLPLPDDLRKLTEYLVNGLNGLELKKTKPCPEIVRAAIILILPRLLLYNKRRSGELEAMSLKNYEARSRSLDPADKALMGGDLTELEEYLLGSQDLIKIRGKGSRIVPVIVPVDATEALEYITNAKVRRAANIPDGNPYVFASTGMGVVRAYDALKLASLQGSLQFPERITSVSVRKYFATMCQVLALQDHELQWVCKHMGHTMDIHKLHYRSTSGYIERINIAKIMMMTDGNLAGHFSGREVESVTVEEILGHQPTEQPQENDPLDIDTDIYVDQDDLAISDVEDVQDEPPRKKVKSSRQPWRKDEEDELRKVFKDNFLSHQTPGLKQCTAAITRSKASSGVIWHRHWETIKKKVNNMIKKEKQASTKDKQ